MEEELIIVQIVRKQEKNSENTILFFRLCYIIVLYDRFGDLNEKDKNNM